MTKRKIILLKNATPINFHFETNTHQLEAYIFQIHSAANVAEGLSYLQSRKNTNYLPCFIILDLRIPVLEGEHAGQKINEDEFLHHPLLVVTEYFALAKDISRYINHKRSASNSN